MPGRAVSLWNRVVSSFIVFALLCTSLPSVAAEESSFIYTIELAVSKDREPVVNIQDSLPESLRFRTSLVFRKDRLWHLELGVWNSVEKALPVLEEVYKSGYKDAKMICTEYEARGCMRYIISRLAIEDPQNFTPVATKLKGAVAVKTSSTGDEMVIKGIVAGDAQKIAGEGEELALRTGDIALSDEDIENSDVLVSATVTGEKMPQEQAAKKSLGVIPGACGVDGLVASVVAPSPVYEQIELPSPDVEASHLGITGLMRVPNGRVIYDGDVRFSASQAYPYQNFAFTAGIIPSVETNFRIDNLYTYPSSEPGVEITNFRSVDTKLQVVREGPWVPAVSVGVMDITGEVRTFASEYVVASKRIGKMDITAGYGGNLAGSIFGTSPEASAPLKGVFGGVEYHVSPKLSVMAEYDPTETLPVPGQDLKVENHYNVGIRYRHMTGVTVGAGQMRGRDFWLNFALTYPFGAPLRPHKYDEPFYGPVDHTALDTVTPGTTERLKAIKNYLEQEGFNHVKLSMGIEDQKLDKKNLYVEYENTQYLSEIKALGRVLRVCVAQAPSNLEYIHVIMMNQNLPMTAVTVRPQDYIDFLNGVISGEEMKQRIIISQDVSTQRQEESSGVSVGECSPREAAFEYSLLAVEPYVNDLSGFFKYRVGPTVSWEKEYGSGSSIVGFFRFPAYTNVTTLRPPISNNPVRSDIVEYEKRTGFVLENLYYNQFMRVGKESFARATIGYPEMQFAAASLEFMSPLNGGRQGIGGEVTYAAKRDPHSIAGFTGYNRITPFVKAYAYFPKLEGVLETNIGTYLAGDGGATIRFTRYLRGGNIFMWYTKTDTSNFTGQNKGYDDRGIGFSLPLSVAKDHDVQEFYGTTITPWTRDVGQKVYQPELKDFLIRFTPAYIFQHWNEILW